MSIDPANRTLLPRRLALWLGGSLAATTVGLAFIWLAVPLDVRFEAAATATEFDPRRPLVVEAVGLGARLLDVQVRDEQGRSLAGQLEDNRFVVAAPLRYGATYTLEAEAVRDFSTQTLTRRLTVHTVVLPRLLGSANPRLGPDGSVRLSFDRPVGRLVVRGELPVRVEAAPDQKSFLVRAVGSYPQGHSYPLTAEWSSASGIDLPPLTLRLATPPPLTVRTNLRSRERLGLAWPITLTFSEPLADRDTALAAAQVTDAGGASLAGQWRWIGRRTAQFTPSPRWPANARIALALAPEGLSAVGGGHLEAPLTQSFTTGPDRRIAVYLDRQRVEAIEDGRVVRSFAMSSGRPGTPTVTGTYYIYARYERKTMRSRVGPGQPGYYVVENVPFAQYFHEGYAFHGAWWHNSFGRRMSHGCVNLSTRRFNRRWSGVPEDAGWLWEFASLGTPVTVFARTPALPPAE